MFKKFTIIIILTEWEESLGGNEYTYGLDGGDASTGVYFSPNTSGCMYEICTAFYVSNIP